VDRRSQDGRRGVPKEVHGFWTWRDLNLGYADVMVRYGGDGNVEMVPVRVTGKADWA
jgi:hypothetical protein